MLTRATSERASGTKRGRKQRKKKKKKLREEKNKLKK